MSAAETTLEVQDPDSLEEPGQEPEEAGVEPSPDEDATDSGEIAAVDDAASDEQPEGEGAAPEGQPRDEHGRFTSAEAAPPAGPSPTETSPPAGSPFSFRVDGLAVEVEGASEHEGKITIPRQAWDSVVQNRLADRGRIQQREERMQTRIRSLESEAQAREDRFKKVLEQIDGLIGDPERLKVFAERYEVEAPRLKLQIENELLKAETQRNEQSAKTRQQEEEEREFRDLSTPALNNAVGVVLERVWPDAKSVDKAALASDLQGLWEAGAPVFFRVTEGDGSGLDPTEHKWGVNLELVRRFMEPRVELHRTTATQTKAAAVAEANQAALGKGKKPKAPPVAPAAGSPAPGGGEAYPTNREEYEAYRKRRSSELNLPM